MSFISKMANTFLALKKAKKKDKEAKRYLCIRLKRKKDTKKAEKIEWYDTNILVTDCIRRISCVAQ